MSAYSDNIEIYLWMCELYNEQIQYVTRNGNSIPDCYGNHAQILMKRDKKEKRTNKKS